MGEDSAKSEENARYSFLLGSALRYEDTDRFLQVYDAVVPKDLPPEQVQAIKDLARKVAELPKEEFDAFAISVKQNDDPSQSSAGMSSVPETRQLPGNSICMDLAPSRDSPKHNPGSTGYTARKAVSPSHQGGGNTEVSEDAEENDSGVFNLSKTTTSSMSDDTEMVDEYESRGVFSYMPQTQQHQQSSLARTMDNIDRRLRHDQMYDDAEVVADSDEGDGEELQEVVVVESNQDATIHGGIEMKTFRIQEKACTRSRDMDDLEQNLYLMHHNEELRHKNNQQYDEAVPVADDDDDEEGKLVIPHQELLRRNVGQYASMYREDSEDYETELPEGKRMSPSRCLGLASMRKASDGVRIEQEVRQRSSHMYTPPFGDPVDFDQVSKASERLIDFKSVTYKDVKNLPPAERIVNNVSTEKDSEGNNTESTGKKKKKKKKTQKDEPDEGNGSRTQKDTSVVDVNGNPVTERSTNSTRSSYSRSTFSQFPRTTEPFSNMEFNGQPISEMDELPGSRSERESQKKSKATRRREHELAQMVKAEDIEGFKGDKKVEELLNFIESGNPSNKKKKKGNGVVNGNSDNGAVPNGHVGGDIVAFSKSTKKTKQNMNKSKLLTSQKDSEKSSEDTPSEKADDSSSGKSESDEVKELDVDVKKKTSAKEEPPSSVPAKSVSPVSSTFSCIKDLDENDDFIFTDFENVQPLAEGEFNVVTRKKRQKVLPQPLYSGAAGKDQNRDNNYYDSISGSYSGYNSIIGGREDRSFRDDRPVQRRGRPMVRSVTPPPTTSTSEKEHFYYQEKAGSERAFSPSAFPALGGMREGRRNSTGDVPSAIAADDSDMESVKSLPLVAGGAVGSRADDTISPIMSYAKIAAGPKTGQNKGGALAAWVGKAEVESDQPSESGRRHSLPELTDPLLNEAVSEAAISSNAQTAKENIVAPNREGAGDTAPETMNTAPEPAPVPVESVTPQQTILNLASTGGTAVEEANKGDGTNDKGTISPQISMPQTDISVKKVAVTNAERIHKSESVILPGAYHETKGLTFGSAITSDVQMAPAVPILDQQEFPAITETVAAVTDTSSTVSHHSKPSVTPPVVKSSPSQSLPGACTVLPAQPKAAVANSKKQKKSVVFLDRRSRSSTPNLGISFGFDTNWEVMSAKPVVDAPTHAPAAPAPVVPKPPATVTVSSGSNGVSGIINIGKEPPVVGFNGLVLTPKVPAVASLGDPQTAPPTQVIPPAEGASAAVIEPNTDIPGKSTRPVPVTLAGAPTDNGKRLFDFSKIVPPNRSTDPNYARGRFAIEEAAFFLKDQWDHVMDRKNKCPNSVMCYQPSAQ